MKAISFPGINAVLNRPEGWNEDLGECTGLPVCIRGEMISSCWKPTFKERLVLLFGGKVYVHIVGNRHPPIALTAE